MQRNNGMFIPLSNYGHGQPSSSSAMNAGPIQQQQQPTGRGYKRKAHQQHSKKLVPFTDVEWKFVQKKFMSEDKDDLQQICSIMNMWICRMGHGTPVFIGITELVLRALVLQRKQKIAREQNILDNADFGLIFGSVIIRFINYVNEVCQPEGGFQLSIANAVSKMGIPSWVVTLRHQATHGQMPAMSQMKQAIKFCRTWLWRKHWSKPLTDAIIQTLPEIYEQQQQEAKCSLGNQMVNALKKFMEWRRIYPSLSEFHGINDVQRENILPNSRKQPEKCRTMLESLLNTNAEEFISFFAMVALAQGSDPAQRMFNPEADGTLGDQLRGTLFTKEKQIDTISVGEQRYYKPIFYLLNARSLLPTFLVEITRLIAFKSNFESENELGCRRHLAGWAEKLLTAYLLIPNNVSTQNWRLILKHQVLAPQFFRDEHIQQVLSLLANNLSDKCKQRLKRLLEIRSGKSGGGSGKAQQNDDDEVATEVEQSMLEASTYSVNTLADLQNRIRRNDAADDTFVRDPLTLDSDWTLAPHNELGAMGLTSDQQSDSLCLAIGCDFY